MFMKHLDVFVRLERWLKKHRSKFHRALLPGATPAELAELEQALGRPVPEDLRALLCWHNGHGGEFAGAFEESWLLLGTHAIAATKRDLDADPESGWQTAWVPVLDNEQGDFLFLDVGEAGTPVRAFWLGQDDHPTVAPSLAAWLDDFANAVERGDYREDPERGAFLRSSGR